MSRWKGEAVHKVFQDWLQHDDCEPDKLRPRAERLLADAAIHPMLRALWAPRLLEAIDWIAAMERENQAAGRRPLKAEADGETPLAGVTVFGRADRIDILASGALAIIDYKTGQPPSQKAVDEGFALQLGLLGGRLGSAGGARFRLAWSAAFRLTSFRTFRFAGFRLARFGFACFRLASLRFSGFGFARFGFPGLRLAGFRLTRFRLAGVSGFGFFHGGLGLFHFLIGNREVGW